MNELTLNQKQNMLAKTCLCFEGGGILGIGHVGALSRLNELNLLSKPTHVVGTSVGSFIAAAFGCGADFEYIDQVFQGLNLKKFKDQSKFALVNLVKLFKNFAPNKGEEIDKVAGQIVKDLTGDTDTTFLEAYEKTGITTTITYLSVNFEKTRYANHITHPNLKIREAIKMSSSIPVFYEPFRKLLTEHPKCHGCSKKNIGYELIVDGGVTDNYPIHVLRKQGCSQENMLGFKLCSAQEFNDYREDLGEDIEEVDKGAPSKVIDYVLRLISIVHNQALRYHVKKEDWDVTIKIDIGNLQTTDFDLTEEQTQWLYNQGKIAVDEYIKNSIQ
jgi:NTE family protein